MAANYEQYRGVGGSAGSAAEQCDQKCLQPRQRVGHFFCLYCLALTAFIIASSASPSKAYESTLRTDNEHAMMAEKNLLEAEISKLRGGSTKHCEAGEEMLFGDKLTQFTQHGVDGASGHSYQIVGGSWAKLTWEQAYDDAVERCHKGTNGYLVVIESEAENQFINEQLLGMSSFRDGNQCWIGASDMNGEGEFEWVAKKKVFWKGGSGGDGGAAVGGAYSNWHDGEPNEAGTEDCAVMYPNRAGSATWNDSNCYRQTQFFVVEFDGSAH